MAGCGAVSFYPLTGAAKQYSKKKPIYAVSIVERRLK